MFQLLVLIMCSSFLQAADQALVPFKNPVWGLESKKVYTAGIVCGTVASGIFYANEMLALLPVALIASAITVDHVKKNAKKFPGADECLAQDLLERVCGKQVVPEDIQAFSAAYERLRSTLSEGFCTQSEEQECEDMLKQMLSKHSIDVSERSHMLRDEHNRLYDAWEKKYKLYKFIDGFTTGLAMGPFIIYSFASMKMETGLVEEIV